jgi:hypothetical protein
VEIWGMQYNVEKCKIMHVGRTNPNYDYTMHGKTLKVVSEETDVGVIVQSNLKPGKQCQRAANVATGVLKTIWRNFHYKEKKVYLNLYKQYVRPHLEFSVTAWAPWLETDKAVLEKVQEKAINAISGLRAKNYLDKCKELGIETLAERRERHDTGMIQTYKILNGVGNIDHSEVLVKINRDYGRTRLAAGHDNLVTKQARTDVRKNSFFALNRTAGAIHPSMGTHTSMVCADYRYPVFFHYRVGYLASQIRYRYPTGYPISPEYPAGQISGASLQDIRYSTIKTVCNLVTSKALSASFDLKIFIEFKNLRVPVGVS